MHVHHAGTTQILSIVYGSLQMGASSSLQVQIRKVSYTVGRLERRLVNYSLRMDTLEVSMQQAGVQMESRSQNYHVSFLLQVPWH